MKITIEENQHYKLYISSTKNRIYFSMVGKLQDENQIPCFIEDWKRAIAQVTTNFTVLSDIRLIDLQGKKIEKLHEKVQSFLTENGLLETAEVMPMNDIADLQANQMVERSGMPTTKFRSIEEAENYLDTIVASFNKSKSEEKRNDACQTKNKDNRKSDFR
ncbi:hypothetical protein V9L05_02950 [Bernardetia sp. Wsw4-3y2]|uniref:hypothetical protein n=1 Tax=unclassified Bernardetia TaxID=2647129 RepID=UPI0030D09E64